ncbi:MAG: ThiF family adenylyltransferase [bacterium]
MPEELHVALAKHLVRADHQEDLCFAIYYPSTSRNRTTAILHRMIAPSKGDRKVHGNASFEAPYFDRALREARAAGGGLAFMHSHPFGGWQNLSRDDHDAEAGHAAAALAVTGLPLVGLTIGLDGAWSARQWLRVAAKTYKPQWAHTVRRVGGALQVTFHPSLVAPYHAGEALMRTVSFWGDENQHLLGRLRIGIVGLGSVGSLVAESLARTGIRDLVLIDFDHIKNHNLDRTAGATKQDAKKAHPKVTVAARNVGQAATANGFQADPVNQSLVAPEGYRAALDCDVLFSCVDRPWPRRVLNHIAYAHLIPVIDGGISVRHGPTGRFKNANWSIRTSGPERACLECTGAYDAGLVNTEQQGYLDDPSYMADLPSDSPLRRRENVHALSMSLAAHEVLQLVALVTGLVGMHDTGEQRFSYFPGIVEARRVQCERDCPHQALVAQGNFADEKIGNFLRTQEG